MIDPTNQIRKCAGIRQGDRVFWMVGLKDVPAIVDCVTPKRACLEVRMRDGSIDIIDVPLNRVRKDDDAK